MDADFPQDMFRELLEDLVPMHQFLGVKVEEIRPGYARMRMPFQPVFIGDFRSQRLHGGIISLLMDAVGGAVGMTTLTSTEDQLATIDMRVDYLRAGKAKDFVIEGELVRSGNRVIVTQMRAFHPDEEALLAEGRAVYHVHRKG